MAFYDDSLKNIERNPEKNCIAENMTILPDDDNSENYTIDAFHRGRFFLMQPKAGHRAGMDAMMLAATVPSNFSGRVADLGSGVGAVGLAVAARCADAQAVLVEKSPFIAAYARKTLALEKNAFLTGRIEVVEADVTLVGKARIAAGLDDRSFDFILMNPPFNPLDTRATPSPYKAEAHVMEEGVFEKWLRTAAAIAKPGANLALIARPMSLADILNAAKGRFGDLHLLPIAPRPDKEAIRIIVTGKRGSRAGGLTLLPPLYIHDEEGRAFNARVDAINNGCASLF